VSYRDYPAMNKLAMDLVKKPNATPENNDTSRRPSKSAPSKLIEFDKSKDTEFLPILYLALLLGTGSANAEVIVVTMDNMTISPPEVSAKVGDTIRWVNKDVRSYRDCPKRGLGRADSAKDNGCDGSEACRPAGLLSSLSPEHDGDHPDRVMRLERRNAGPVARRR
jgi:hypothetical protein